jgi:hypothetical protein
VSDLEQHRRTVRVLELLADSYRAHAAGDKDRSASALIEANQVDAFAVTGIAGAMMIGEIPDPNSDLGGYLEYVDGQRAALAAAEQDAQS